MKAPFSYVPALPAVIGWIAGILLWHTGGAWWATLIFVLAGLALMLLKRHYIAFGLLCVGAGWVVALLNAPATAPEGIFDGNERRFAATVVECRGGPTSQSFFLQIDSAATANGSFAALQPFKIQASALAECTRLPVGSRIRFNATLEPLSNYADYPWQADMTNFYLQNGLAATAYIDMDSVETIGRELSLKTLCDDRRNAIISLLAHSGLSDNAFGLISALLVAYDDELNPNIRENFRASGIAHALALSGFHVGVIVLFVSLLLIPLRFFPALRRLRFAASIALIWAYVALVGAPLSVVRAAIMVSVYLLGLISERPTNSYNSLCVALLLILAFSPFSLFSAGLQLSVSAVLGILAFAKILNPVSPKRRAAYKIAGAIATTVAALLGTMVISVCYFHSLPLAFLFSNLFIVCLMPLLMFGGVLLVIIGAFGGHFAPLAQLLNWLSEICNGFTAWLSSLPFAELGGIYLSTASAIMLILTCTIAAIAVNINNRRGYIAPGLGLIAALTTVIATAPAVPAEEVCVLRHPTSTALIMRHGTTAVVVPTCRRIDLPFVAEKLNRDIEAYAAYCGADSVLITCNDFTLGNYRRCGALLTLDTTRIAIAPIAPSDTLSVDYLLIGRVQRTNPAKLLTHITADTIILGSALSPGRASKLNHHPTPTINLRHQKWTPKPINNPQP